MGPGTSFRHTEAVVEVMVPLEDITFSIKVTLATLVHPAGEVTITSIKGFPVRVIG